MVDSQCPKQVVDIWGGICWGVRAYFVFICGTKRLTRDRKHGKKKQAQENLVNAEASLWKAEENQEQTLSLQGDRRFFLVLSWFNKDLFVFLFPI